MQPPAKLPSEVISEMDRLYGSIEMGAAADQILKLIDPIVEQRLGELLNRLEQCPPELGPILDIKARLCEMWRMRKKIKERQLVGKKAVDVIKGLCEVETVVAPINNGRPVTGQH
jgi:hypothetical protein